MKRWFIGMIVVCAAMLLLAGAEAAPLTTPSGPFNILHKQGAIYNSTSGWNLSTPPYYAGSVWAVDFTYTCEGVSILHKDGGIWNATTGWNLSTPPYYSGSDYARAIEYVRDLTGCWGMEWMQWNTTPDTEEYEYNMEKVFVRYPYIYVQVTSQIGTRLYGQVVRYDPLLPGCYVLPFEGTVIGDHITILVGEYGTVNPEVEPPYQTERFKLTLVGLIFWDVENEDWEIKGSFVGSDLPPEGSFEPTCTEEGRWGVFNMWPEDECICPPIVD